MKINFKEVTGKLIIENFKKPILKLYKLKIKLNLYRILKMSDNCIIELYNLKLDPIPNTLFYGFGLHSTIPMDFV